MQKHDKNEIIHFCLLFKTGYFLEWKSKGKSNSQNYRTLKSVISCPNVIWLE